MTEQLQLLRVVVPRQCLFRTFHVKYVKEKIGMLVLHLVVKGRPVDGKVGLRLGLQVLLEHRLPDLLVGHENLR